MEVTWKVCAAVVKIRLKRGVDIHDALHGFLKGIGTGMTTMGAKLAQQLDGLF